LLKNAILVCFNVAGEKRGIRCAPEITVEHHADGISP